MVTYRQLFGHIDVQCAICMVFYYVLTACKFAMNVADIDECVDGVNKCDQICHNNNGSYSCLCDDGFALNDDGLHCDGKILKQL